jgi:hypothetical protein
VPQDAIGTVLSNRSRVCMFLRNSRLEPYTAGQLSRPAAISWGGLVFDLVFRSSHPSINFSDTSTNRFWAAVWPSAITWRSKVLRPPFWPLGQSFHCRLPPCLRRTLRTNTTTINYTHFSEGKASYITAEEFRPPHAGFTASFVRSPGIHDFETLDESLFAFSNLETGLWQSDLDFWNLEFPITETLGPVLEPSDSLPFFPQDPAIEQTVEELLEIAGEAPFQRDGTSLISTVSSFTSPASPSSSLSPSIRCSWPTCKKAFKNRSDYK